MDVNWRVYDKVVHDQVFKKNVLFQNILKNVAHQVGSTTKYISVRYGRNIGSAAGSEAFTLPIAGNQQYLQANVTMKYNFHQIGITDVSLQASKRSKEFLVNVLESEYNGAKEDMQRQMSRQGYGDGTGVVCRVASGGTTETLTLNAPMIGKNPADYFDIGNALLFAANTAGSSSTHFSKVDGITANNIITVVDGSDVADDDYVFIAHNATSPDASNAGAEIMGLKGLIDDSTNVATLQGLARGTYIWWKSYINSSATQRSLTEELMHTTFLEAKKKGDPKYALTHFDVFSAYGQLLSPDRRYTSTMQLQGGFTGLDFNSIPLVPDYDCPYDEMYFIDPSSLSVEDLAPMSFLNEDGSILDRSSTKPAWNATLRYYANLCTSAPNKNSALRDVIK